MCNNLNCLVAILQSYCFYDRQEAGFTVIGVKLMLRSLSSFAILVWAFPPWFLHLCANMTPNRFLSVVVTMAPRKQTRIIWAFFCLGPKHIKCVKCRTNGWEDRRNFNDYGPQTRSLEMFPSTAYLQIYSPILFVISIHHNIITFAKILSMKDKETTKPTEEKNDLTIFRIFFL